MPFYCWLLIFALLAPTMLKIAVRYLIVPIKMKSKVPLAAKPTRTPTTIEKLSPEMKEFVSMKVREFRAEGFETVVNNIVPEAIPRFQSVQLLMVNPAKKEVAVIVAVWGADIRSLVFAVRSHFADGKMIVTGVNPRISPYPSNPAHDSASFSWVFDAAYICEAHRRRLKLAGREGGAAIVPPPDDGVKYLDEEWEESVRWSVRSGYRWLDEKAGVYRHTWKGAYLLTWKDLNPVQRWRVQLRNRKARQLWKVLGMGDWKPDVVAQPRLGPAVPAEPIGVRDRIPFQAATMPDASSQLHYQPPHERNATFDNLDGQLVVRVRRVSFGDFILVQIGRILAVGLLAYVVLSTALIIWIQWRLSKRLTNFPFHRPNPVLYICLSLLIYDAWVFIAALRRSRASPAVQASHGLLRFANAPHWKRSGTIASGEISRLRIVADQRGVLMRIFRLEVQFRDARKEQPLFLSTSASTLQLVKRSLIQATGIATPQPVEEGALIAG